jgi:hypothetical protein
VLGVLAKVPIRSPKPPLENGRSRDLACSVPERALWGGFLKLPAFGYCVRRRSRADDPVDRPLRPLLRVKRPKRHEGGHTQPRRPESMPERSRRAAGRQGSP